MSKRTVFMGTTTIEAKRTIGEIQDLLADCGARGVSIAYTNYGQPSAVSFSMPHPTQPAETLEFQLPCRWEAVRRRLESGRHRKGTDAVKEQAFRTAWRQIFRWLQAQLELIDSEQVEVREVFLPYMIVPCDGDAVPMFEAMEHRYLALPSA